MKMIIYNNVILKLNSNLVYLVNNNQSQPTVLMGITPSTTDYTKTLTFVQKLNDNNFGQLEIYRNQDGKFIMKNHKSFITRDKRFQEFKKLLEYVKYSQNSHIIPILYLQQEHSSNVCIQYEKVFIYTEYLNFTLKGLISNHKTLQEAQLWYCTKSLLQLIIQLQKNNFRIPISLENVFLTLKGIPSIFFYHIFSCQTLIPSPYQQSYHNQISNKNQFSNQQTHKQQSMYFNLGKIMLQLVTMTFLSDQENNEDNQWQDNSSKQSKINDLINKVDRKYYLFKQFLIQIFNVSNCEEGQELLSQLNRLQLQKKISLSSQIRFNKFRYVISQDDNKACKNDNINKPTAQNQPSQHVSLKQSYKNVSIKNSITNNLSNNKKQKFDSKHRNLSINSINNNQQLFQNKEYKNQLLSINDVKTPINMLRQDHNYKYDLSSNKQKDANSYSIQKSSKNKSLQLSKNFFKTKNIADEGKGQNLMRQSLKNHLQLLKSSKISQNSMKNQQQSPKLLQNHLLKQSPQSKGKNNKQNQLNHFTDQDLDELFENSDHKMKNNQLKKYESQALKDVTKQNMLTENITSNKYSSIQHTNKHAQINIKASSITKLSKLSTSPLNSHNINGNVGNNSNMKLRQLFNSQIFNEKSKWDNNSNISKKSSSNNIINTSGTTNKNKPSSSNNLINTSKNIPSSISNDNYYEKLIANKYKMSKPVQNQSFLKKQQKNVAYFKTQLNINNQTLQQPQVNFKQIIRQSDLLNTKHSGKTQQISNNQEQKQRSSGRISNSNNKDYMGAKNNISISDSRNQKRSLSFFNSLDKQNFLSNLQNKKLQNQMKTKLMTQRKDSILMMSSHHTTLEKSELLNVKNTKINQKSYNLNADHMPTKLSRNHLKQQLNNKQNIISNTNHNNARNNAAKNIKQFKHKNKYLNSFGNNSRKTQQSRANVHYVNNKTEY